MNDEPKHQRGSIVRSDGPTRRTVLKGAAATGLFATVPWSTGRVRAETGETTLTIDRWVDPLPVPGVVTPTSKSGGIDRYEISMDQFYQQVLSDSGDTEGLETEVWGYNGAFPGPTIEARPQRKVEVKYVNNLGEDHLLSVDHRVHGAEEDRPDVRNVTHLHGGVVAPEDDGYPDAWASPSGVTDPKSPVPYKETKEYPNVQEPTTLWYHDHAIGITRLNVYAGLAAFYLLCDPMENSLPSGMYEIPIVFQDRSFGDDGELFYPSGEDEGFEAEFWGDVPVVNGKTYPYLEVEPRSYRFRTLNGSNGRAFNMTLEDADDPNADVPLMRQIATDQGFLDAPVSIGPGGDLASLTLLGAERADLVVDFAGFEGRTFFVTNDAETPYTGANEGSDIPKILQIRVGGTVTKPDETADLIQFLEDVRAAYPRDGPPVARTRYMTLDTGTIDVGGVDLDSHFLNDALWTDPAAIENVRRDTSEDWVLANTTGDAHPIHLHLVDFDVVKRQDFDVEGFFESLGRSRDEDEGKGKEKEKGGDEGKKKGLRERAVKENLGDVRPIPANERGPKDTVSVYPNEAVTIRPSFTDFTGHYVWHCHILEHEDQEMMLPYVVGREQE